MDRLQGTTIGLDSSSDNEAPLNCGSIGAISWWVRGGDLSDTVMGASSGQVPAAPTKKWRGEASAGSLCEEASAASASSGFKPVTPGIAYAEKPDHFEVDHLKPPKRPNSSCYKP